MQEYYILPTVFNMVVDAVVLHWESRMAEGGGGDDRYNSSNIEVSHLARQMIRDRNKGRRWTEEGLKVQEAIFCAYDGMVASTNPRWLQTEFDVLLGLFERVGLKTNVRKTVGVV